MPRWVPPAKVCGACEVFLAEHCKGRAKTASSAPQEMCWHGYLGNEVLLPELIASTTVFTQHGELADFYLVPIASECFILSEMKRCGPRLAAWTCKGRCGRPTSS